MEHVLTRLERADCPHLILRGEISVDDLDSLISVLSNQVLDNNEICILVETLGTFMGFSELEIINFLKNFPPKLRALKIAVLVDQHKTRKARLYESIVYSNGFPIRFFVDEEMALTYIKS